MQCILCGCEDSKAVVVKNRKSTKTFFRCTKCDFCFLERSQLLDYHSEKERYLFHQNSEDNLGYMKWLGNIVDEAMTVIELKGKTILDYGCGHNPVLPQILRNKESQISKIDYYDLFFRNSGGIVWYYRTAGMYPSCIARAAFELCGTCNNVFLG